MDDEIPEQEVLNLQETLTCARVAAVYLCRSAGRAAARMRAFADASEKLFEVLGDLELD